MQHPLALIGAACLGASLACGAAWAQDATTASTASPPAPKAAPKTAPKTASDAPYKSAAKQPSKNEEQALKWFSMLDADGDGRISWKEAQVGIRLRPSLADEFKRADLNGDGYLTQDEIRKVADRRRAEREARRARERAAAEGQTSAAKAPAAPTATR